MLQQGRVFKTIFLKFFCQGSKVLNYSTRGDISMQHKYNSLITERKYLCSLQNHCCIGSTALNS